MKSVDGAKHQHAECDSADEGCVPGYAKRASWYSDKRSNGWPHPWKVGLMLQSKVACTGEEHEQDAGLDTEADCY